MRSLRSSAPDEGIHALSIPTPFAVGRVNCYLIDDDPLTLVDPGPNSATALYALEQLLAEHGRRTTELERIVVTHQHADHQGLVDYLARHSGAEVCALDALAPWLAEYWQRMDADDRFAEQLMQEHGIPREVGMALRVVSGLARGWGAAAHVTAPLGDGATLEFAGRTLHVHHRPGHSPSDIVLHDRERGVLIAGDHLIKHISSNAVATRPLDGSERREQALVRYLASMRATREMDVALVLPGHGKPFSDHRALIDERIRGHERRAAKIARLIAERPRSAHQLARDLWGNVAVTQAFLTLSEVLGHTDILENQGVVRRVREDGGPILFEAV